MTTIVWAFGAGFLFVWSDEALRSPFANVCTAEVDPPYRECFTEEAQRLFESGRLTDQLVGRLKGAWAQIDTAKTVRRMRTTRYQNAVESFFRRQVYWAAAAWGSCYLLLWVARGFQSTRGGPAS